MKELKIIVADDNKELAKLTKEIIEKSSKYKVSAVLTSSKEQMDYMENNVVDIVITDDMRKGEQISGVDIVLKCEYENRAEKFIYMTATPKSELLKKDTLELPGNVIGYLQKPFNFDELIQLLEHAEEIILGSR